MKHILLDIVNIKKNINNLQGILTIFHFICRNYKYNIIHEKSHLFKPQGLSIIFLLAESHMSIHTYPENNAISFDLYTCREYDDDSIYLQISNILIDFFQGDIKQLKIINRNIK